MVVERMGATGRRRTWSAGIPARPLSALVAPVGPIAPYPAAMMTFSVPGSGPTGGGPEPSQIGRNPAHT